MTVGLYLPDESPPRLRPAGTAPAAGHRLERIVTRAMEIVAHQLQLNRAETVLDLAEGLPPIQADATQLQQVVVSNRLSSTCW